MIEGNERVALETETDERKKRASNKVNRETLGANKQEVEINKAATEIISEPDVRTTQLPCRDYQNKIYTSCRKCHRDHRTDRL